MNVSTMFREFSVVYACDENDDPIPGSTPGEEYSWHHIREQIRIGFDMIGMLRSGSGWCTPSGVQSIRGQVLTERYVQGLTTELLPKADEIVLTLRPESKTVGLIFIKSAPHLACFEVVMEREIGFVDLKTVANSLQEALAAKSASSPASEEYWWSRAREHASLGFERIDELRSSGRPIPWNVRSIHGQLLTQGFLEWMSREFVPQANGVVLACRPEHPKMGLIFIQSGTRLCCFAVEMWDQDGLSELTTVANLLQETLAA
jgi:hypothetical protein